MFMSQLNHTETFHPDLRARLNAAATAQGVPLMFEWNGDPHEVFDKWLDAGVLFTHIAKWWPMRTEPNVLLVHYNDLKADLEGEMRRVAEFLGIDVPDRAWPSVVERCTFASMRARSDDIAKFDDLFQGGGDAFLHKGTNGRWRDFLTADELTRYDAKVAELVPADAASWLEAGSLGLGQRPEKIG
jgi:aryl sulfotransferase